MYATFWRAVTPVPAKLPAFLSARFCAFMSSCTPVTSWCLLRPTGEPARVSSSALLLCVFKLPPPLTGALSTSVASAACLNVGRFFALDTGWALLF
jgi:hypothetical protein